MTTVINSSDVSALQEQVNELKRDLRYINYLLPNLVNITASLETLKNDVAFLKTKTTELDYLIHGDLANLYTRIEQIQKKITEAPGSSPPPQMFN